MNIVMVFSQYILLSTFIHDRHLIKDSFFHVCSLSSENYRPEADGGEQTENQEPVAELYKKIQHGGDIPIRGLQKPAPEKTKSKFSRLLLCY